MVNVSSNLAERAISGMVAYNASKAALNQLTRSLALEWAPSVRVNAVCPGWVDTPMARPGSRDPQHMKRVYATMAMAKIATPEDIARAIVFLASDRLSGHMSGTILPVAGGMEGRLLNEP